MDSYNPTTTPWQVQAQDFPTNGSWEEKQTFLLHYAILAPSSYNTQPWRFAIDADEIRIFGDLARWLKIADPERRELHISLGCALENLLIAAEHFGYGHEIHYFPSPLNPELVASVKLSEHGAPTPHREVGLFDAMVLRHTDLKPYQPELIPTPELQRIQACCVEDGIRLRLSDDPDIKWQTDQLLIRSDAMQFANHDFREELGYWIGQGVFGTSWLLTKLSQISVTYLNAGDSTASRDSAALLSAPVLGIVCSRDDDRESHVKAGQVFERIFLTATALGLSMQAMSQVMEVPMTRSAIKGLLPLAYGFPQQPFRIGFGESGHHKTPRRPLEEVLIRESQE